MITGRTFDDRVAVAVAGSSPHVHVRQVLERLSETRGSHFQVVVLATLAAAHLGRLRRGLLRLASSAAGTFLQAVLAAFGCGGVAACVMMMAGGRRWLSSMFTMNPVTIVLVLGRDLLGLRCWWLAARSAAVDHSCGLGGSRWSGRHEARRLLVQAGDPSLGDELSEVGEFVFLLVILSGLGQQVRQVFASESLSLFALPVDLPLSGAAHDWPIWIDFSLHFDPLHEAVGWWSWRRSLRRRPLWRQSLTVRRCSDTPWPRMMLTMAMMGMMTFLQHCQLIWQVVLMMVMTSESRAIVTVPERLVVKAGHRTGTAAGPVGHLTVEGAYGVVILFLSVALPPTGRRSRSCNLTFFTSWFHHSLDDALLLNGLLRTLWSCMVTFDRWKIAMKVCNHLLHRSCPTLLVVLSGFADLPPPLQLLGEQITALFGSVVSNSLLVQAHRLLWLLLLVLLCLHLVVLLLLQRHPGTALHTVVRRHAGGSCSCRRRGRRRLFLETAFGHVMYESVSVGGVVVILVVVIGSP